MIRVWLGTIIGIVNGLQKARPVISRMQVLFNQLPQLVIAVAEDGFFYAAVIFIKGEMPCRPHNLKPPTKP